MEVPTTPSKKRPFGAYNDGPQTPQAPNKRSRDDFAESTSPMTLHQQAESDQSSQAARSPDYWNKMAETQDGVARIIVYFESILKELYEIHQDIPLKQGKIQGSDTLTWLQMVLTIEDNQERWDQAQAGWEEVRDMVKCRLEHLRTYLEQVEKTFETSKMLCAKEAFPGAVDMEREEIKKQIKKTEAQFGCVEMLCLAKHAKPPSKQAKDAGVVDKDERYT